DAVDRFVVPARADLDGHRDRDRVFDGEQNFFELRQVAEQVRSAAAVDHFFRGAAAVDVHEIRARFLGYFRGPAHAHFVVTEDLDRNRALFLRKAHHLVGAHIAAREALDADEFGDDQANAAALFGDAAER